VFPWVNYIGSLDHFSLSTSIPSPLNSLISNASLGLDPATFSLNSILAICLASTYEVSTTVIGVKESATQIFLSVRTRPAGQVRQLFLLVPEQVKHWLLQFLQNGSTTTLLLLMSHVMHNLVISSKCLLSPHNWQLESFVHLRQFGEHCSHF
jgi:hypothetical protein